MAEPRDSGAATLVAAAVMVVLLVVTGALLHVGSAVSARHRAQSAADLSALAGAQRVVSGDEAACRFAGSVASRMRVEVTSCVIEGLDVVVAVQVRLALSAVGMGAAVAVARAGPVE